MNGLSCTDCGKTLPHYPRRKGTRCRACNNRHMSRLPEVRAKVSATARKRFEDPAERAKQSLRMKIHCAKPEVREKKRADGLRHADRISRMHEFTPAGHPSRLRASRSLVERRMGWCPLEYRDWYRRLRNNYKMPAAEARAIIEAQVARDVERYQKTGQLQQASRLKAQS